MNYKQVSSFEHLTKLIAAAHEQLIITWFIHQKATGIVQDLGNS